MNHYVVMVDTAFLGIHIDADSPVDAQALVLRTLDHFSLGHESIGITGIEYGLRSTKTIQYDDNGEVIQEE